MYIPASFRVDDRATLFEFIGTYDFAVVISDGAAGLVATHAPLLLDRERSTLVGHFARANPHWRDFDGAREVLAIFQGPHAYVSPAWYANHPSVPTWNYTTVHVYGQPRIIDEPAAVDLALDRLVSRQEARAGSGWASSSLPTPFRDRMRAAIVAFEMPIERIEGKFKLGQNRSPEDQTSLAKALVASSDPGAKALAEFLARVAGGV